jgi:hypothetical protein
MKIGECTNCFQEKEFYRGRRCKECYNEIEANRYREKQLKNKPNKYLQCSNEECDGIWKLNSNRDNKKCFKCGSTAIKFVTPKIQKSCNKCGKIELMRYDKNSCKECTNHQKTIARFKRKYKKYDKYAKCSDEKCNKIWLLKTTASYQINGKKYDPKKILLLKDGNEVVLTDCPVCNSEAIDRWQYSPKVFDWCRTYGEEVIEIKELLEDAKKRVEEYTKNYKELTGKKFYKGIDQNANI